MRVAVLNESVGRESRVALTPRAVPAATALGAEVIVEVGAGEAAGFSDRAYQEAGALLVGRAEAWTAEVVVVVAPPSLALLHELAPGAVVVGFLDPAGDPDRLVCMRDRGLTGLAFEATPRSTLAQSVDALSSQATVAGYAAIVLAAQHLPKFFPMLTTAAGTVPPARVLVIGAGVAGLQAMATARRLGAVVSGYDVRPEAAEQIASLAARVVPTDEAPGPAGPEGGAPQTDSETAARQRAELAPHVAGADVVVTTAAVPGGRAPLLIDADMVDRMSPGSVIVDLAGASGGNCALSVPDEVVRVGGVTVLAPTDLPSRLARDASELYARNVVALLERLVAERTLAVDLDDDIVGAMCVVHASTIRRQDCDTREAAEHG